MKKIDSFSGDYFWLSNFYPCEVKANIRNKSYSFKSSEALFQGLKSPTRIEEFTNLTPDESKRLGRKVRLRDTWDEIKDDIMYFTLKCKFDSNPNLKNKLVATGDTYLEEGNTWGDIYWGTVNGEGHNVLGKLLMSLRSEYSKEVSSSKEFEIIDLNDFDSDEMKSDEDWEQDMQVMHDSIIRLLSSKCKTQ